MTEIMSVADQARLMGALERAVDYYNKGDKPDDAIYKAASEGELTPVCVHRIATAFNKSLSVHKLTSKTAADRADNFPLASSDNIVKRLFRADPETPKISVTLDFKAPALAKTASELSGQPDNVPSLLSDDQTYLQFMKIAEDLDAKLQRRVSEVGMALADLERSEIAIADKVAAEPEARLTKYARNIVNRYGESGELFLKSMLGHCGRGCPIQKTANYAVFPMDAAHTMTAEHMRKLAEYCDLKDDTVDFGDAVLSLFKKAEDCDMLRKTAGVMDVVKELAKPSLDMATGAGASPADPVLDPALIGKIDSLNGLQAFYDSAANPALRSYPIEKIVQAFNTAVRLSPSYTLEKNRPLLVPLMAKLLAQDNRLDTADLAQHYSVAQAKARAESAEINPVDEARAGLEQSLEKSRSKDRGAEREAVADLLGAKGVKAPDFTSLADAAERLKNNITGASKYFDSQTKLKPSSEAPPTPAPAVSVKEANPDAAGTLIGEALAKALEPGMRADAAKAAKAAVAKGPLEARNPVMSPYNNAVDEKAAEIARRMYEEHAGLAERQASANKGAREVGEIIGKRLAELHDKNNPARPEPSPGAERKEVTAQDAADILKGLKG